MLYNMKTQRFIKNSQKYNNIKLAKGVILDYVEQETRYGNSGISTQETGNVWHMLPKGRAIFKDFEGAEFFEPIKNMRICNELLCYELSKQVGVLCAECELATKDNKTGVVSYDVAKNNEYLMDGYDLVASLERDEDMSTLTSYATSFKKYEEYGYTYDKEKVLTTLFKIVVFDILTIQSDRYNANILFMLDDKKKTLKVAPLIDNEFAFNIQYFDYIIDKDGKVSKENFVESLKQIEKLIKTKYFDRDENLNKFKSNLNEVVKIAQQNSHFKQILQQMLQNYDIDKAIEKVENQGLNISDSYKKYLKYTEQFVKQTFNKELNDFKEIATEYKVLYEK